MSPVVMKMPVRRSSRSCQAAVPGPEPPQQAPSGEDQDRGAVTGGDYPSPPAAPLWYADLLLYVCRHEKEIPT